MSGSAADRRPTEAEIGELTERGYLVRPGVLEAELAADLAGAVSELARHELHHHGTRPVRGNGYYVRDLIWKDARFHRFVRWGETIALARAMLGARVRVAIDARVAAGGVSEAGVHWHIHTPAADGSPPWATVPQTMACLVYLDDVEEAEGALCVIPGSHRDATWSAADAEAAASAGREVRLWPGRGDMVVTHGNLWHRTLPTAAGCRQRRVLFVGYGPAWMTLDPEVAGQPRDLPRPVSTIDWPDGAAPDAEEARDLLGGFRW